MYFFYITVYFAADNELTRYVNSSETARMWKCLISRRGGGENGWIDSTLCYFVVIYFNDLHYCMEMKCQAHLRPVWGFGSVRISSGGLRCRAWRPPEASWPFQTRGTRIVRTCHLWKLLVFLLNIEVCETIDAWEAPRERKSGARTEMAPLSALDFLEEF